MNNTKIYVNRMFSYLNFSGFNPIGLYIGPLNSTTMLFLVIIGSIVFRAKSVSHVGRQFGIIRLIKKLRTATTPLRLFFSPFFP